MNRVHSGGLAAGIFFVLAGGAFLLEDLGVFELRVPVVLPLLLIGLGVALLLGQQRSDDRAGD